MKSIVLEAPGQFRFDERPDPSPKGSGDALVRVRRIGVCGTDLHAYRGDQPFFAYPRVLGHELGVEVVASASDRVRPGDYGAVEPYLHCGVCRPCREGRTNCCSKLSVLGVHQDGGLCDYLVVPASKLHVSAMLPLEHLALVEMLGIGAHAVARAGITAQDQVLVIGAGPIGLSAIQFARLVGADVVVMETNPDRMAFCKRFMDVRGCVAAGDDAERCLREQFDGDLPGVVLDATGNRHAMANAFSLVDSGGRLVLIGLFIGELAFYDPEFHRKELTLLSSRNATAADFAYVIRMLESGKINLNPWITHRVGFDDVIDAFPTFVDPAEGVIKAMIDLD
ncbi:MAG: zinc-binding alcohol dehydrogenase family protein [Rhodothermales bacterium]